MKKIIMILISAAVLIIGSAAFAQEIDFKQGLPAENALYGQMAYNKKEQLREFFLKVKEKQDTIGKQRAEIRDLRLKLNDQARQAKVLTSSLKKLKTPLDAAKISTIKQILGNIKEAQQIIESTQESFKTKNTELRNARQRRKPEVFLQVLDDIIEIQQKRINVLTGILSDLEKLNGELQ